MIHDKKDERINIGAGMVPTYHATESVEEANAVVEQCKTSTERLRAMLDERGVKWESAGWPAEYQTFYEAGGVGFIVIGLDDELGNSRMRVCFEDYMTPEQAIAATLGAGTCTLINAADDLGSGTSSFMCFECGYTALDDWWEEFNFCPNCGRRVINE